MKYFVESLPETCAYCDCCHTRPYNNRRKIDGEKFCGILNEDVEVYYHYGNGRPEFCPLKEVPDRKGKHYELNMYDTDTHYEQGWNACLDEMTTK